MQVTDTPPPQLSGGAEPLPGDQAGEGHRPLTSKRQALRWLATELGVTGAEAHRLFVAYQRDQERPTVTASKSYKASFIDWLMRQAPSQRPRTVAKWQIGQGSWRLT